VTLPPQERPPVTAGKMTPVEKSLVSIVCVSLFLLVVYGVKFATDGSAPSQTDSNASDDFEKTKVKDPKELGALQGIIMLNDFACPEAKLAYYRGQTRYGMEFETFCGPVEQPDAVNPAQRYAVYLDHYKAEACDSNQFVRCGVY